MWPIASDVAHNIVCVYVTNRCCTKMAYPIEMPFGADSRGANKPCIRWESRSPQEQAFWRNTHARKCLLPRKMLPFVKLLWTLVMDGHPSFHPPNSVKSVKKKHKSLTTTRAWSHGIIFYLPLHSGHNGCCNLYAIVALCHHSDASTREEDK